MVPYTKATMKKTTTLSRGTTLDNDKCVEQVGGNRFEMILIATIRAREIKRQQRESQKREHLFSNVTALQEIQEGKVGRDYLKRIR
jgi:DNA-directed RNA polymerase omega subunit